MRQPLSIHPKKDVCSFYNLALELDCNELRDRWLTRLRPIKAMKIIPLAAKASTRDPYCVAIYKSPPAE